MGRWVWAWFLWGVALAAGRAHLLILGEDGRVYALGENEMGQLGDGTQEGRLEPRPVEGLLGVIPFYAESLVLGHQWKRVCRLRVSGAFSRTRHRSATTSIISSRS